MKRLVPVLILLWATMQVAAAAHVAVRLIPDRLRVAPGGTLSLAVEQAVAPGWHTYWLNPGQAGMATTVDWTLPAGWQAGPILWPAPKREPVGPLMDYGYEGTVRLLVDVRVPATARPGAVSVQAKVSWLACREICVPEEAVVRSDLFVEANAPPPDAIAAEDFAAARAHLPVASPWSIVYAHPGDVRLYLAAAALTGRAKPQAVAFFPAAAGLLNDAAAQTWAEVPGGLVLTLKPGPAFADGKPLDGVLVLTSADGSVQALSVHAKPGAVPGRAAARAALALALFFAFLGGLILNVMPCVLPVLAIKVLSLVQQARGGARAQALAYTGGVVLSFVALGGVLAALRAGGLAVGWGFQLQEPSVVAALALLLFAVGLNLSGVFEVNPVAAGARLARRPGLVGAFFSGALAVAVAAPCTAPFMASAVGLGMTQSLAVMMGVFVALGVGFALPFLLIGLFPPLSRRLPKPGAWMIRLKKWLAVPMYAAAGWLIWVLARQTSPVGVAVAVIAVFVLGGGLWAYGASRMASWRRVGTVVAALAGAVSLVLAASLRPMASSAPSAASAYSAQRLAQLRSRHPVFVDVSASWCITCLVNEEAALDRPAVRAAFARRGVALLKADWTRRDPAITQLLATYGRSGVPLYLYYPAGAGTPQVLPQILTEGIVLKAVEE